METPLPGEWWKAKQLNQDAGEEEGGIEWNEEKEPRRVRMEMEEEHFDLIPGSNLSACLLSGEPEQGWQHLKEFSDHLGDSRALLQLEDELPQRPALLQCSSRKD